MRVFGRRHSRPQLYLPPCGWQDAASVGAKGKGGFVFGFAGASVTLVLIIRSLLPARAKKLALAGH